MPGKRNEEIYIGGIEKRDIVIVDYDPEWKNEYKKHAKIIKSVLNDKIILIEHIGSTSIESLAAKPIIDIMVVIKDTSDENSYVKNMEEAGYQLRIREPDWYEHRMFRTPKYNVHIHFYSENCPEIKRVLTFRDWLRSHPVDRKQYAILKRKLAENDWDCVDDYADAKSEFIEMIIKKELV